MGKVMCSLLRSQISLFFMNVVYFKEKQIINAK